MLTVLCAVLAPLLVSAQDLNLTEANINVRLISTNYNGGRSVLPCISKISDEYGLGSSNVLMENEIICDNTQGRCRSVVVEFPDAKTIYFTYRGTTQLLQLLRQGPRITEDFLGLGQVKRYYVKASEAFWVQQERIVTDPKYADYKFVYTGHSLGGALAVLSALRAAKQAEIPKDHIQLMTFGEPRIGHRNFTKKIKNFISDDIRITQNKDNVPTVPVCKTKKGQCDPSANDGFYHHGMEYWFYNATRPGDVYKKCDGQPESEDPSCVHRIRNPTLIGIKPWCDHILYLGINMVVYGMSDCKDTRLLPGPICPFPF